MLTTEQKEILGKVLPKGITVEELTRAITSEEEATIEIPEGVFMTTEDKDTFGKNKYDEGGKNKTEILLKEMSKKVGLESNAKTGEAFIDSYKSIVSEELKVNPDKKVKDLQDSLAALQSKYELDIETKDNELIKANSKLNGITRDKEILSVLPELKEGISQSDFLTLFNTTHQIKEDGIYQGDKLLKDDLESPLGLEQAVSGYVKDKSWNKEVVTGNGGRKPAGSTTTPKTYSEFQKVCKSKGWNESSQEAKEYLRGVQAKDDSFNMDE